MHEGAGPGSRGPVQSGQGRLPPGSEVRYRPLSLWAQYRGPLAGALAVGLAQSALIAGLLMERRYRRRAQAALAARGWELQERNAQVRRLTGQLIVAQEQERAAVARELHDEVGQALTTVKINLDTLRLIDDPSARPALLDDGVSLVDHALEQVRDLSLLLHPSVLDHLGLVPALRALLHHQAQRVGYEAAFTATGPEPALTPEQQLICYRVAQEALTNTARHAQARHVAVDLRTDGDQVRLTVRDDGVGFDVAAMRQRALEGGSLGLRSLEERAALGEGRLEIDSAPGRGTTLVLTLPAARPAAPSPPAGTAAASSPPSPSLTARSPRTLPRLGSRWRSGIVPDVPHG